MRELLAAIVFVVACDSRAAAPEPQAAARSEPKSKEYESCGATMHCQDDLRCFDNACRRIARSTVGDYHAALGAAAHARGDLEPAIAAYKSALGHYDAERLPLPPDVDCAYGAALVAAKDNKEHAELGARVLHRCVLAAPVGSALRDRALAELTKLADSGLDPLLLGANKTADLYLTKGRATTETLEVSVTAVPVPSAAAYAKVPERLAAADLKQALMACRDKHKATTHKDALIVVLGLKVAFVGNPDYEEEGSFATKIDPPAPGAGADDACVRAVVEPAIKGLRLGETINSTLTVTIK